MSVDLKDNLLAILAGVLWSELYHSLFTLSRSEEFGFEMNRQVGLVLEKTVDTARKIQVNIKSVLANCIMFRTTST